MGPEASRCEGHGGTRPAEAQAMPGRKFGILKGAYIDELTTGTCDGLVRPEPTPDVRHTNERLAAQHRQPGRQPIQPLHGGSEPADLSQSTSHCGFWSTRNPPYGPMELRHIHHVPGDSVRGSPTRGESSNSTCGAGKL